MDELDLGRYLYLLRRWLWLVVLCALLAGGAAYVISSNMRPVYEARTTLLLEQSGDPFASWVMRNAQWEPATYAQLLPQILPEAAAELGLDRIDAGSVTVDTRPETRVVTLRVRDEDPQRAAAIANIVPQVFAEYSESLLLDRYAESKAELREELDRLETEIDVTQSRMDALGEPVNTAQRAEATRLEEALSQQRYNYGQLLTAYEQVRLSEMEAKGNLVVFRQASVPTRPVLPNVKQNTLLAALVGAMLALGIVFFVDYLDDTLKTPDDLVRTLGLVPLGGIASLQSGRKGGDAAPLVTVANPKSSISEAFRALRTNVQFASVDWPSCRLLVTSPGPSDGKSLVAANLATVFAQAGQAVVLVDSDLRRPSQHLLFNLSNKTGLTKSLLDGANPQIDQWTQPTMVGDLCLLTSGPLPLNPSELLGSQRMKQITALLVQRADVVLFDSPPVLAVTDAAVLSQQVDGVLLVIEAGSTRKKHARRALEELGQVNAPILGAVLNKIPVRGPGNYSEYYFRHYYSSGVDGTSEETADASAGDKR